MPRRRPSSCSGELMANAWIIEPLPAVPAGSYGTVQIGPVGNMLNDHAGVVVQMATDFENRLAAVTLDMGADVAFDTVLIFGLAIIPGGSRFRVDYATAAQGNFSGGHTNGPEVSAFAGDQASKLVTLWSVDAPVVARYINLVYLCSVPPVPVRFARVVVGRRIELERNFSFGAGFGVKDLGSLEFSRRGVLLRNRGAKLQTTALTFSSVRRDEVEQLTRPLIERIGNTECVAVVTDPAAGARRGDKCYFGPLVGDLSQTWRRADAWEAKINMVSIF